MTHSIPMCPARRPSIRTAGLVLAAMLAAGRPARADPPSDPTDRAFAECTGLPARDRVAKVEPIGPADCLDARCDHYAIHVTGKDGARWLVFPPAEGRACAVFPIGRADARATGRFLTSGGGGGGETKLFALRKPGCTVEDCPLAIALRGAAERPVAVLLLGKLLCDQAVELARLKLFADHDSLSLLCRSSVGGGYREGRYLIDAAPGDPPSLDVLLSLDCGSYMALSPDEKKAGRCAPYPAGFLRVEKPGARPLLRVLGAPFTDADLGKPGTVPARQLAWDPKQRTFAPSGAPDVGTKINPFKSCRPRTAH